MGDVCCHGSCEKHLESILEHGLKAGCDRGQDSRREVHFSIRILGEAFLSGMMDSCQIAVYLDLPRAARDGLRFYRSSNDVLLTEGLDGVVPPQYIELV